MMPSVPGVHKPLDRIDLSNVYEFLSKRKVLISLTVLPAVLLFVFINLLPILWAIFASVHSIPAYGTDWTFIGLDHYAQIISAEIFRQSLLRSMIFAGGSVFVQLTAGVGIALALNQAQEMRFKSLITAGIFLPYLIPTAVVGFMAIWIGNGQWGILGILLTDLGIIQSPIAWFGNADLAMISAIAANSWKFTMFVTIMVLAKLQSIPENYYEAARMCGANSYQRFRDITLPSLRSVIFIVLLLRGIWMFNKFDILWVTTQGGPGELTTTIPIYTYRIAFLESRLGEATAIATMMFLLIAVGAVIYFRYLEPAEEVQL